MFGMHIETIQLYPDRPVIGVHSQVKDTTFEEYVELETFNSVDNSSIGGYSYTGSYCYIQNSVIGRFASISDMVRIGPTNHPYSALLSIYLLITAKVMVSQIKIRNFWKAEGRKLPRLAMMCGSVTA